MMILLAAILQPEINNYEDIVYKLIGAIGVGVLALIFYFLKSLFKKGFLSEKKKLEAEEDVVKEQLNAVNSYRPTPASTAKEENVVTRTDKEAIKTTVKVKEEENNGYTSQYEY